MRKWAVKVKRWKWNNKMEKNIHACLLINANIHTCIHANIHTRCLFVAWFRGGVKSILFSLLRLKTPLSQTGKSWKTFLELISLFDFLFPVNIPSCRSVWLPWSWYWCILCQRNTLRILITSNLSPSFYNIFILSF